MLVNQLPAIARRILWLCLCGGVLMQLSVRDSVDALSMIFYALPLPALLAVSSLLAVQKGAGRLPRRCAAATCLLLVSWWSVRSWQWHDKPASAARLPGEVRVLFWNLSRPPGPLDKLADFVRKFDPDFIGCTEPCDKGKRPDIAAWQALLPGYQARPSFDELIWFTRGAPISEQTGKLATLGSYADVRTILNGQPAHFILVDVWGDPRVARTGQVRQIYQMAQPDPRIILLGDFNTPSESAHFDNWRASLTDALEAQGRGWRETWFYHLPVLSLDHIWAGAEWKIIECEKTWSAKSDHAALMVRLSPR